MYFSPCHHPHSIIMLLNLKRNFSHKSLVLSTQALQYLYLLINAMFQLNIHQFKCFARFGLMHIVATNICVWIRTVFKEGIKDIAAYRVARGEGVSEDYMIKGTY